MLLVVLLKVVWTRTNEPIFRQVSVPGTYQKPEPYRMQRFTYSTGLALAGRSAACAPATTTRPAAEPRRRLCSIFIEAPVCPSSAPVSDGCPTPDGHHGPQNT